MAGRWCQAARWDTGKLGMGFFYSPRHRRKAQKIETLTLSGDGNPGGQLRFDGQGDQPTHNRLHDRHVMYLKKRAGNPETGARLNWVPL